MSEPNSANRHMNGPGSASPRIINNNSHISGNVSKLGVAADINRMGVVDYHNQTNQSLLNTNSRNSAMEVHNSNSSPRVRIS